MCDQDTCVYFRGPPSIVIGNSLFITGCERRPGPGQGNWKEAKRTRGIADEPASQTRLRSVEKAQGAKRALLCKSSRDEDSRNRGHCYANQVVMRIHATKGNQVVM